MQLQRSIQISHGPKSVIGNALDGIEFLLKTGQPFIFCSSLY